MSDRGTTLIITPAEGAIGQPDMERLRAFAAACQADGTWTDGMGNPFQWNLISSAEAPGAQSSLTITLSEYWVEDDDEEFVDEMIEMDKEKAEELRAKLSKELGPRFRVELYAGEW